MREESTVNGTRNKEESGRGFSLVELKDLSRGLERWLSGNNEDLNLDLEFSPYIKSYPCACSPRAMGDRDRQSD